jgi:hypothetical protein
MHKLFSPILRRAALSATLGLALFVVPASAQQSTSCVDTTAISTWCITSPPINDPSCSAPPTVIDDSPRVKYVQSCGGITVLCGSLGIDPNVAGLPHVPVQHASGPPCPQPTTVAPPPPPTPPMPAPQVSPNDRYSTSNGIKSATDMQAELQRAGYTGPFDVPSVLATYQRTTNSPVRPL